MVITRSWNEATPDGSKTEANTMDAVIHRWKQDTREQLTDGDHLNIFLTTNTGARHVATNSNRFPVYDSTGLLKVFKQGSNILEWGDGVALDDFTHERVELDNLTSGASAVVKTFTLEDDSTYLIEATYLGMGATLKTAHAVNKTMFSANRRGGNSAEVDIDAIFTASTGFTSFAVFANASGQTDIQLTLLPIVASGGINLVLLLRYWRVD